MDDLPNIYPPKPDYVRPWIFLAARLRALIRLAGVNANVYEAPPQGAMATPALIVTPADPWVIEGDEKTPMQNHREQYRVTCVVPSSDPGGAVETLYNLACLVMQGLDTRGWWWIGVTGLIRIDSGGVQYLGVNMLVGHSVSDLPVVQPQQS